MAIAQPSQIVTQIRGSIGDRTYKFYRGKQLITRKPIPGTHNTPAARRQKNNFSYTSATLFKQLTDTKARLKQLVEGLEKQWNWIFLNSMLPIAESGNTVLNTPYGKMGELDGVVVQKNVDDNIDVSWANRSTDPNIYVEFIDAGFHSDGEFAGDAHFAIPVNNGHEVIFADSWIGIMFLTNNGVLDGNEWSQLWLAKFGLDFTVKPTYPA